MIDDEDDITSDNSDASAEGNDGENGSAVEGGDVSNIDDADRNNNVENETNAEDTVALEESDSNTHTLNDDEKNADERDDFVNEEESTQERSLEVESNIPDASDESIADDIILSEAVSEDNQNIQNEEISGDSPENDDIAAINDILSSADVDALFSEVTETVDSKSQGAGSDDADDLLALAWEQSLNDTRNSDLNLDLLLSGSSNPEVDLRELDQSEIDNLLGFANDNKSEKKLSGIDAILNKTLIYYERLPMMEVVFDRLLRLLSTSLRNFTSDNVEISLESMKSTRFGDYLNSVALPAMLGVFKAKEWDNQGLLVVDSALIYSIVDVLLGGRRSITATRVEGRPYTTIERNLIEKLMNVFLEDLKSAFEPVSQINFFFERLEINPHFAMIARAANAGILVRLHIEIDDRGGRMSLMLPYATIEPIRELLLQNFMGEKFGRDSIWEQHLANELWETDVELNVHLAQASLPLRDILAWKPGDQVQFSVTPSSLVSAYSGDHELFRGAVGHKNGHVAIRVEENLIFDAAQKSSMAKGA